MDCAAVFVKYVLFVFNILVTVCGILLIVFGSIMLSHLSEFSSVSQVINANSIPIAIVVLGCIIFIIAFLGCCGAIRENSCCTFTYSIIMLIMFVCQIALIIYVWTQRDQFLKAMDNLVTTIWNEHETDQKVMDALQLTFNCCGKNSYIDYGLKYPNSCCGAKSTSCTATDILSLMKKPGCSQAFADFWKTNTDITRYAGLGVAAIELVAFIFACCLANQVRNNRRRANY